MFGFLKFLFAFLLDEDGATAVEYAIMLGLIVLSIYSSVQLFGGSSEGVMGANDQKFNDAINKALGH